MSNRRFRSARATDEELDAHWGKVFAPYDFVPTVMVSDGMEKADRALRLLKHWRSIPVSHQTLEVLSETQ